MGRVLSPEVTEEVRAIFGPLMEEQTRQLATARILAAIITAEGVPATAARMEEQANNAANYVYLLNRR